MSLMQKLPDPSPADRPVEDAVHDARALVPNGSTRYPFHAAGGCGRKASNSILEP